MVTTQRECTSPVLQRAAKLWRFFFCLVLWVLSAASPVAAAVLTVDTIWQGEVQLDEDLVVPEEVTLTIRAGTVIRVRPAESTKTDPEYLSYATELTVRGRLQIEGTAASPVRFLPAEPAEDGGYPWAGIIVDGGRLTGRHLAVTGAETAVLVLAGAAAVQAPDFTGNRYGVVVQGEDSVVHTTDGRITANDYGLVLLAGGRADVAETRVTGNDKHDRLALPLARSLTPVPAWQPAAVPLTRSYGNEAIAGTVVWKGRVVVDGVVRVPPDARLIVLPGTVVEFTFRDTNGDTIGENGLMIQGQLVAKGTPERPIFFRSAEKTKRPGQWDAINILGSDRRQNLIEYCQIEHAYRGTHFHFANVFVNHVQFRDNYRGSQFQESLVTVQESLYTGNKSAVRARDSQVIFQNNRVYANGTGANFYRMDIAVRGNRFVGNGGDGLRIREGAARVTGNLMAGNRYGLLIANAVFGRFAGNVLTANLETGLAVRDCDRLTIAANAVTANGVTGISLRGARAAITGNLVAGNGERGIGIVAFAGTITGNTIVANGLYGIGLEGPDDIDAVGNWWGDADLAQVIYDHADDHALGRVRVEPVLAAPAPLAWPLADIGWDTVWAGAVVVDRTASVPIGATLTVLPGTEVRFGREAGLEVTGRLIARGTARRRILFTAAEGAEPASWGEISLDHAEGSVVQYCDFRYATWGLHVHYTPMTVSHCRFLDGDGGMRYRSGPYEIHDNLFAGNRIGMRAYLATAAIRANVFRDNEIGIFVREKGSGLNISGNNLYNNERYNLRVGDFNSEDVDARHNYWGGDDPLATIYDGRMEDGIGIVRYEPFAAAPYALAVDGDPPGTAR